MTEFETIEEPPWESQSELPESEFIILAYGTSLGSSNQILFLSFEDIADNLRDFLEDEASNCFPILDEMGWDGKEFEGLMEIRCLYVVDPVQSADGVDYDPRWEETDRRQMRAISTRATDG